MTVHQYYEYYFGRPLRDVEKILLDKLFKK